jgi:hypothetical protein
MLRISLGPKILFTKLLFPTFGTPTTAIRIGRSEKKKDVMEMKLHIRVPTIEDLVLAPLRAFPFAAV